MKKITMRGKTVEEATKNALQVLGLSEEAVNIAVLNEGRPGMLGMFGGEEAEVEVKEKISIGSVAKDILQEILNKLSLMAIGEVVSEEDNSVGLDIKGEDLGKAIGKDGAMLKALQVIVSSIVSREFKQRIYVNIDAGGYKAKQEKALSRLAKEAAKDVEESGEEKVLPLMSSAERRIVHMALKEEAGVETESRGEGAERRLVIMPRK